MVKNKIVYNSPFIPAEFIAAYDFIPIRKACLADDNNGAISIETGVCPYMRGFINYAGSSADTAGIIITTICDQMRRGSDYINTISRIPYFLINIPSTWQTVSASNLYLHELERLGEFLVSLGGVKPENKKLVSCMLNYEKKRNELLSNQGISTAKEFAEALDDFYINSKISVIEKSNYSIKQKVPIGLIGCPMTKRDFDLFDIVSDNGGEIVLNGTESGERTFPSKFNKRSIQDFTMQTLTESYFNGIPDIFKRPNNQFFQWLKMETRNRNIRGIILIRYIWCDLWHGEVQRIKEWLTIPFLEIELHQEKTITREENRIQAFMEMLR